MNVFLYVVLFIGCSPKKQINNYDKFANTIWASKVAPNCIDTLKFFKNGRLLSYSCEIEYQAKGSYTVKGDTVVAVVNEDSHGTLENWRYTYVLNNNALIPIRSEQQSKGKWILEKSNFDKTYMFKKIR